jgi:hypothetical protein
MGREKAVACRTAMGGNKGYRVESHYGICKGGSTYNIYERSADTFTDFLKLEKEVGGYGMR